MRWVRPVPSARCASPLASRSDLRFGRRRAAPYSTHRNGNRTKCCVQHATRARGHSALAQCRASALWPSPPVCQPLAAADGNVASHTAACRTCSNQRIDWPCRSRQARGGQCRSESGRVQAKVTPLEQRGEVVSCHGTHGYPWCPLVPLHRRAPARSHKPPAAFIRCVCVRGCASAMGRRCLARGVRLSPVSYRRAAQNGRCSARGIGSSCRATFDRMTLSRSRLPRCDMRKLL